MVYTIHCHSHPIHHPKPDHITQYRTCQHILCCCFLSSPPSVPPTVQPVLGRVVGLELMHVTLAFVILDASPAVQAQSVHWTYGSVHGTSVSIPSDSLTATFSNLTGMFSDDRLNLTLSGLNNDFEGTYTMTATNEAGSTSASIQLLIESQSMQEHHS